jgi:5-methylcytosine-specific restriction endonuclease McrA
MAAYRLTNDYKQSIKKYAKSDKGRVNNRIQSRARKARLRGIRGSFNYKQWEEVKEKHQHTCFMCFRTEPEIDLTIDHIIPLSKRGTNNISNIQPLCFSCNSKKKDKIQFLSCPVRN